MIINLLVRNEIVTVGLSFEMTMIDNEKLNCAP